MDTDEEARSLNRQTRMPWIDGWAGAEQELMEERSMEGVIRIKPHHLVDVITSIGAGARTFRPHAYGHAVHTVSKKVLSEPDVQAVMELGADDICQPCIHNIGGLCDDTIDTSFRPEASSSKREYNLMLDERWCEKLELKQEDSLTVRRFCELLRERAEDITGIYREMPEERTAERKRNLEKGIEVLLEAPNQQ